MDHMEIIDNFLQQDEFDKLERIVMGNRFPWYPVSYTHLRAHET